MKKKLILVGGGGHCKVCIDIIEQLDEYEIMGVLDLPTLVGSPVLNYKVIGTDDDIPKYAGLGSYFLVTVGQIKSAALRKRLFTYLRNLNANIATIIAKTAYCSRYAKVEEGTIIMHNAIINAGVKIGYNCIINNGTNIDHESIVGNHTHISTSAVINGECNIGSEVFIGSNSTVINNISIANEAIVGAGAIIVQNISSSGIYVGRNKKIG